MTALRDWRDHGIGCDGPEHGQGIDSPMQGPARPEFEALRVALSRRPKPSEELRSARSYIELSLRPWQIVIGTLDCHDMDLEDIEDVLSYATEAAEALGE